MRELKTFEYNDACYRISASGYGAATAEIVRQRRLLEEYCRQYESFRRSLEPLDVLPPGEPEIASRMHRASVACEIENGVGGHARVGPMAAVAGAMAQAAVEAAAEAGDEDMIVDNGGDMYLLLSVPAVIGAWVEGCAVGSSLRRLGFRITPEETPLAVCSSSSFMGHSLSLGDCDLATVFAKDAALADAAATLACNEIRMEEDLPGVLEAVVAIPGIKGAMAVKGDRIGLVGSVPKMVVHEDARLAEKVTKHEASGFEAGLADCK